MQVQQKTVHRAEAILAALMVVAGVLFIIVRGPRVHSAGIRLYFPDADSHQLKEEIRPLPLEGSTSERAEIIVRELLLGPLTRNLVPVAPAEVAFNRAIATAKGILIDIQVKDLASFSPYYRSFADALRKSIAETLPGSPRVILYINSQPTL
ncbi:MAG: hypothetical protein WHT81_02135 [Rectinemataceae bacterium]|nr:GerMN domain-containing protein [Spirochaetaceae bacterium]